MMTTPAEDLAATEFHIRLMATHPVAAFALLQLNQEIETIRARMPPAEFAALQRESKRIAMKRGKQ